MGCNMNFMVEYYDRHGNKWWPFTQQIVYGPRCYDTFSLLAGIRGIYTPPVPVRGLPEENDRESILNYTITDISEDGKIKLEENDIFKEAEVTGWLTLEELIDHIRNYEADYVPDVFEVPELFKKLFNVLIAVRDIMYVKDREVRIVFAFDC